MKQVEPQGGGQCPDCGRCRIDSVQVGGPAGWRLALGAAGLFLLPVVLAIVGAVVVGTTAASRFAAACGGLVAGMVLAVVAGRLMRPKYRGRGVNELERGD